MIKPMDVPQCRTLHWEAIAHMWVHRKPDHMVARFVKEKHVQEDLFYRKGIWDLLLLDTMQAMFTKLMCTMPMCLMTLSWSGQWPDHQAQAIEIEKNVACRYVYDQVPVKPQSHRRSVNEACYLGNQMDVMWIMVPTRALNFLQFGAGEGKGRHQMGVPRVHKCI